MNSLWKQWSIVTTDVLLGVDTAVCCNYRCWVVVESNPWQQSGLFAFSRILMAILSHWFSLCLAVKTFVNSELKLPSLTQNRKWGADLNRFDMQKRCGNQCHFLS